MATVIGVHFKMAGKVYYFDPEGVWPTPGTGVIVETTRGIEYGTVVTGAREIDDERIVLPLKKVVRLATAEDTARVEANRLKEQEAYTVCVEKIRSHKLDMKLVSCEITFDMSKMVFYFTSNGRVDFRDLVKDLASVFKTRIELRQIGVRDEARMLGGLGICGRPICCGAFLGDFQPVSIKMAKEQNLSLNPTKISGNCGRLMCCLKYEQETYEETLHRLPKVGKEIMTPDGIGCIVDINVIRETVKVRVHNSDDTFDFKEYALDDLRRLTADDSEELEKLHASQQQRMIREQEKEQKAAGEQEDPDKKKHYPHPKAQKNLSATQFLDNMGDASPSEAETEDKPGRKRHHGPKPPRATASRPEAGRSEEKKSEQTGKNEDRTDTDTAK